MTAHVAVVHVWLNIWLHWSSRCLVRACGCGTVFSMSSRGLFLEHVFELAIRLLAKVLPALKDSLPGGEPRWQGHACSGGQAVLVFAMHVFVSAAAPAGCTWPRLPSPALHLKHPRCVGLQAYSARACRPRSTQTTRWEVPA